jgi:hypothetical protein
MILSVASPLLRCLSKRGFATKGEAVPRVLGPSNAWLSMRALKNEVSLARPTECPIGQEFLIVGRHKDYLLWKRHP